ncbi:MAG TPA: aminotransferase class V-fold PLP-dependent enzyme [Acidimicrobiales bacterium]|nr:aminotransferase class V-fold PLP-dependent enzyme [Acidimicrobiales bacterium]
MTSLCYLDHAATTPLHPEALAAMLPFLGAEFANPSSSHRAARQVRSAVDEAREQLAELFGCAASEVVFTSGGTEADNLAVKGAAAARAGAVVVSAVEHHAVLGAAARVGATTAPVDGDGLVDPAEVAALLGPDGVLCSVMAVNNETGVVQPVADVAEAVHDRAPRALVHCDAVQAFPLLPLQRLGAPDLVSFSAHKFGGPKGVGVLVVREGARERLRPLIDGGSQEDSLRAGTENVAGIVGMAVAARLAAATAAPAALAALRDDLGAAVRGTVAGVTETGSQVERVASICHLVFADAEAEELLLLLDEEGVAASAGAACAAGAIEASHVLLAMGRSTEEARRAVRFSLGAATTRADIERAAAAVGRAHRRLTRGVGAAGEN